MPRQGLLACSPNLRHTEVEYSNYIFFATRRLEEQNKSRRKPSPGESTHGVARHPVFIGKLTWIADGVQPSDDRENKELTAMLVMGRRRGLGVLLRGLIINLKP